MWQVKEARGRIIVALDVSDPERALQLVGEVAPHVGYFKLGLEFLMSVFAGLMGGTDVSAKTRLGMWRSLLGAVNGRVFVDGKFCDISNTVGAAAKALGGLDVSMFNVHASAGFTAMEAAVANRGNSRVLAVTVLTSLGGDETTHVFGDTAKGKVLRFTQDALRAGCDGVICSPEELCLFGDHPELGGLLKVTPGVRPEWAAVNDQKRTMRPGEAIQEGADYLVIGRPITRPPEHIGSPAKAAELIAEEIAEALSARQ